MSRRLVECVPNFSEGRDEDTIEAIAQAIRETPGCTLLDVDPGKSTNRTVYTFVASPEDVIDGVINAVKVARVRIDMRKQKGAHARNGAMDVCPFVPLTNTTMEDCVQLAIKAGKALGEIGIPVYLYAEAAQKGDHRVSLAQLRSAGEYEGLEKKLTERPDLWEPDFGPKTFVPEWGVSAVGARSFLIAYNVNVLGTKEQAHRLALDVRSGGRGDGEPGKFEFVKGRGWYVDEYDMAQVTMNLDDFKVSPPHEIFEYVKERAKEISVGVCGTEIVGLVPLDAILMAADYYIKKEGLFILEEEQKVRLAIERLGLSSVSPFDPHKKIIEYLVKDDPSRTHPLINLKTKDFIQSVAARTAAPGGGSVAALSASLGMALSQMMAWMTYGRRKWEAYDGTIRQLIPPIHEKIEELMMQVDADTDAFNTYMIAMKMPKNTPEEAEAREKAMQDGLKEAIEVPLRTMRLAADDACWSGILKLAEIGNPSSRSDLEVGAKMLEAGAWGALRNVKINLKDVKDEEYVEKVRKEADMVMRKIEDNLAAILKAFDERE